MGETRGCVGESVGGGSVKVPEMYMRLKNICGKAKLKDLGDT